MSNIIEIPLASIAVGSDRARNLDPDWAEGLARIVEQQGLFHPISVRAAAEGHALVSGLHRLEAFRILGRETIPAILSDAASDDEARLQEVMENLGRHELIALDRCHHLYELKQVWEARRARPLVEVLAEEGGKSFPTPETEPEVFGFASTVAERIGLSKRYINISVKIWSGLVPTVRCQLVGTDTASKHTELKALSELPAQKQMKVLDLILSDDHPAIKNVAGALEHLETGITLNPFELRFAKASKAIAEMDDPLLDQVLIANEARVIASLKRMGRI